MCPNPFSKTFPKEYFCLWLIDYLDPSRGKRMQQHICFKKGLKIITAISFCGTSVILLCHVEVYVEANIDFCSSACMVDTMHLCLCTKKMES